MSADWHITQEDGSEIQRKPWNCVPGMPPRSHKDLE